MKKKGLTTLETTFFITIFVAAWLVMYIYFKRAVQANWKTNIDTFSDEQYDAAEIKFFDDPRAVVIRSPVLNISWGNNNQTVTLATLNSSVYQLQGWGKYNE